jgi:hypothetical protein
MMAFNEAITDLAIGVPKVEAAGFTFEPSELLKCPSLSFPNECRVAFSRPVHAQENLSLSRFLFPLLNCHFYVCLWIIRIAFDRQRVFVQSRTIMGKVSPRLPISLTDSRKPTFQFRIDGSEVCEFHIDAIGVPEVVIALRPTKDGESVQQLAEFNDVRVRTGRGELWMVLKIEIESQNQFVAFPRWVPGH